MTAPQTALDAPRLQSELVAPHGPYSSVEVVSSTGSTNADLREAASDGGADRTARIAGEQTAGEGRRSRQWSSPAGSGVYVSVLLRPVEVSLRGSGSISIVAGLAVLDMAHELGVDAHLKWPNDVLLGAADTVDEGKCAGILSELIPQPDAVQSAIVVGIGVNVLPMGEVGPGPRALPATSLAEHGARTTERTEVALGLLRSFAERERRWREASGDIDAAGLRDVYREHCSTLGASVEVSLPDGSTLTGTAADIDTTGELLVDLDDGTRQTVLAGDVAHLRKRS